MPLAGSCPEAPLDGGLGLLVVSGYRGRPHGLQLVTARRPRGAGGAEAVGEPLERGPRVAQEAVRRRVIPADLVRIHVDLDHLLRRLKRHHRHPRAHRQQDIGPVEVLPDRRARPEGGAQRQVARIAERALALGGHDDGRLEVLGDRAERVVGAREVDAAAGQDHGMPRCGQERDRALDLGRGRCWPLGDRRVEQRRLASSSSVSGGCPRPGRGRPVLRWRAASRIAAGIPPPRAPAAATW